MTENQEFLAIHTSDRLSYKRCRRKWDYLSTIRRHLEPAPRQENIHFWFGTGFHFALQDYHGYKYFDHPAEALEAYYNAFTLAQLPPGAEDLLAEGIGMLDHYLVWEKNRERFETYFVDGVPQCEVPFRLELKELSEIAGKPVIYQGTFDGIAIDENARLWLREYKTAASIDTEKTMTDPQIKAYAWAAEQWYDSEVEGVLYYQFLKTAPKPVKRLKNGAVSLNKQQRTSYQKVRTAMLEQYPDAKFPSNYIEFLGWLAEQETPEGDRFVRMDRVRTNEEAKIATYNHILAEGREMIDPNLAIYPNPTRDCAWDCDWRSVCIMAEEGDDWEAQLAMTSQLQKGEDKGWQKRIKYPQK